ncbi:sodium-dependent transporter [Cellvibrio sp. NN19]|uniref:sodium-dependent transporter n=1 Tax=Cellvibrio chitinivorans TaxID=3102792 RepID=UPI002B407327|nr:sodium-dependent transporter [Cellvibrio sp. NN19]
MKRLKQHVIWGQRGSFILAATGSAVGLGNIWKFPYITGENGGGAFVLMYLVCIAVIGIPIMMAEILMGRRARANPIMATEELCELSGASKGWMCIGWMGALAGLIILSFYAVIAGWTLEYISAAVSGEFTGLNGDTSQQLFDGLLADRGQLLQWHSVFIGMTVTVLALGVTRGLEAAVRWMMPLLFVLLLVLLGYAMVEGEFVTSLRFMFSFNPEAISWESALTAMGHSFFTLSLGMGAIMAYGAYMPSQQSVGKTVLVVALLDTLIALVAGVAIFALVFATPGISPGSGPGLMFVTLPVAFGNMSAGVVVGSVFFVMVMLAAWTSTISLLEPGVAYLTERFGFNRVAASLLLGGISWALGLGSVLSFNDWADKQFLWGKTFFDSMDFIATNIMLPLGGVLIALFVGWKLRDHHILHELVSESALLMRIWRPILRYISPIAVLIVLINGIFPVLRGVFVE